ncbi:terminase large subunit [Lacipirellula sp.]|uniref:terminase large subunit n=1 Tax=Lacipirellula sp. TaxID=2691419 RepID=UPI003D10AE32
MARPRNRPEPTDPKGRFEQYIQDVISGRRVTGLLEKQAVRRHLKDLKRSRRSGIYFDEDLATRACNFFPLLKHTDGEWAGQPFELKPLQLFIVWCLFGWRRVKDGMRRYRRAFLSMARGNGKTYFAAVLTLLLFAFDCPPEPRAECFAAATTKKQARQVWGDVKALVEARPELKQLIRIFANVMTVPATGATFEPLGGVGKSADGKRPHLIICDELHAWMDEHRELWDKLTTAMGKRRQPLFLIITTAGSDESELWEEQYDLAVKILDPKVAFNLDDWFVMICEIDEGDKWYDEKIWPKSNPLMNDGVIKIDELRSLAKIAREDPVEKNNFLRYRCNTKVTALTKLISSDLWARGGGKLPDLKDLTGRGGFDWGWKDDLAAMALTFPLDRVAVGDELLRSYATLCQAFIPESTKRNLAEEPWAGWIAGGWLKVTAGETTDTAAIYGQLAEWQELYGIRSWAMDPNNCREFGSRIQAEYGIEPFWFGQTHGRYNEPTRELITAVRERRFFHGDNPLLAWSMQNIIASTDSRGYIKPEKRKSKEKIDPACAVIMSLSECLFGEREAASFYDSHEFEAG